MRKFTLTAVLCTAAVLLAVGQSLAAERFEAHIDWVNAQNINNDDITLTVITMSADFVTIYDKRPMVHNFDDGSNGHWTITFSANTNAVRWKVTIESSDSETNFIEDEQIDPDDIQFDGQNDLVNEWFHWTAP